jgi:transcription elongation factor GreA
VRSRDRLAMLDLDGAAPLILTREGKRLLTERAHALRGEILPRLRAALEDPERDGRVDAEYERAVDELRRLAWLVDHATMAEELAGEPAVVDLGTAVTVRDGQGVMERFLIVHPIEAPLDDVRISVRSPLAQALLGHRVGEEVEVAAPSGPTPAGSSPSKALPSARRERRGPSSRFRDSGTDMGGGRHPTPASQRAVDAWVALGGGLGVGIGARLGNVLFWIVIGAVAGLAIAVPEDGSPTGNHP